ncbi:MAG: glycosyltransferase family 4 protein [bacterium]
MAAPDDAKNTNNNDLTGKTILQVIPELDIGGAERTTIEMAEAILGANGQALVVSAGGRLVPELEKIGARHILMPVASKNPITMWHNAQKLQNVIKQEIVDLIHARSRAPAWSAYRAALKSAIPFVTTYHGIYKAKSALKRYYNSVMARGDRVIANSDFTKAAVLEEHYPYTLSDMSKLITIHRGADLTRFSPEQVAASRVEALELAWHGGNNLRLLLPGRLTSWKGQETLIEAASIIRASNPGLNIRIVLAGSAQGRNSYEEGLKAAIMEANLQDVFVLPGNCRDMAAAYKWADLTISASTRPEAFGRVAVEAQAMGCPIIATAHGGACETVVDKLTGFLIPPGDATALAEAILKFEDMNEGEREQMSGMAIAQVKENFSIEKMKHETLKVYKSLLM